MPACNHRHTVTSKEKGAGFCPAPFACPVVLSAISPQAGKGELAKTPLFLAAPGPDHPGRLTPARRWTSIGSGLPDPIAKPDLQDGPFFRQQFAEDRRNRSLPIH